MLRLCAGAAQQQKSPQQEAPEIDYARVRKATIRVGAGMRWLPSWYLSWWNAPVIKLPKGETEKRLGYKS